MNHDPDDIPPAKFTLESIEETSAPDGAGKEKWYSYIIGRGKSVIKGKRSGTLHSVTEHAENVVEDLNSRSHRHGSIYVSRRNHNKG